MAQLSQNRSSSAASEFFGGQFAVNGQIATGGGGAVVQQVGYQPVIENIPEGTTEQLAEYNQKLTAAKERDCLIRVRWTGDADLDLLVVEPSGTICSRLQKRTSSGGIMLGDQFSPDKNHNGEIVETYVLPKGFAGNYQLVIKRVWGDVTSGKATVSITNHYNSNTQRSLTQQVELDKVGAIVNFALDRGRRTESLSDHAIKNYVREQLATNRLSLIHI